MKRITVIGSGYVGTAVACLLSTKNMVAVIDTDKEIIDKLSKQISHLDDPQIKKYLKKNKNNLKFSTELTSVISKSDLYILCLPTDFLVSRNEFDTKNIESVISELTELDPKVPILIKSTVPIHFTDEMNKEFKRDDIVFSPEFLREGQALYDSFYPSRIIFGSNKPSLVSKIASIFIEAVKKSPQVLFLSAAESESIKLFSNSYLAMRVAFFNELDSLCLSKSFDAKKIIEGVCSDSRIGNDYNNPSFGFGGYCLPKDTKQLISQFKDIPNSLITSVIQSNEKRKKYISNKIIEKKPKNVGIYRLQMKEGSDNFKESSVINIIKKIKNHKIPIIIYEPLLRKQTFLNSKVITNFTEFAASASIILANRYNEELNPYLEKTFTRDIFQEN